MPFSLPIALALLPMAPPAEAGRATFTPTAAEAEVPPIYRMEAATFQYSLREIRAVPGYAVSTLTFPSPVETAVVENNTVHAEYFRPDRPGRRPAVVVSTLR